MIAAPRLQHVSSGALAFLVHAMLLAGLMFGLSWKNLPHLPIEADLWTALPEPPPPPMPKPLPEPEPLLEPQPLPQPVAPPPAVEAKPRAADIALEKAERKREAELKREETLRQEEARQAELDRQAELKRQIEEKARLDKEHREQLERERMEKEKQAQSQRQVEQEIARQMKEEIDADEAQYRVIQDRARAGRQVRLIAEFRERIRAKIQSYIRLPLNLKGNREVEFQVNLLANGEVSRIALLRGSGQPAYDIEVERAILKASPLPLPKEREAAAPFRDGLILKFRPSEDAAGK